jgi:hypothetical protein
MHHARAIFVPGSVKIAPGQRPASHLVTLSSSSQFLIFLYQLGCRT